MSDVKITRHLSELEFNNSGAISKILGTAGGVKIYSTELGNLDRLIVEGNSGILLKITDDLTGTLWSLAGVDGLPVFEVINGGIIKAGNYGLNTLYVNGDKVGIGTATLLDTLNVNGNVTMQHSGVDSHFHLKYNNINFYDSAGAQIYEGTSESHKFFFEESPMLIVDDGGLYTPTNIVSGNSINTPYGYFNRIYSKGDTDTYIDFTTADRINFIAGNTSMLSLVEGANDYIYTTQRMVIGSSSYYSQGMLNVNGNIYLDSGYVLASGSANVVFGFDTIGNDYGISDGNSIIAGFMGGAPNKYLYGGYNDESVIVIDMTTNRLGINEYNPQYSLHVSGDTNTTATYKLNGTTIVDASRNLTNIGTIASGSITSSSTVQGTRLISTTATGTAPFTVTSTTAVTNLNADLIDGVHLSGLVQTSRQVIAGNGLTGGGALSSDVTLTMGTPGTLTSATTNATTSTSHTHAITTYALSGTANQITVTGAGLLLGAAATLSLPQNIHTAATPTFAGMTLTGTLSGTAISLTTDIAFTDTNGYWLKTATNWGIYWDTTNNELEFHGAGTVRFYTDLDNGNTWIGGTGTIVGAATLSSTLAVTGATTLNGALTFSTLTAPNAPVSLVLTEVGSAIQIQFNQSSTTGVTEYQVWRSETSSTTDFDLIAIIKEDSIAATMAILDTTYLRKTTQYYRIYAIKGGKASAALTGSILPTSVVPDVTNVSVKNFIDHYVITYEVPDDRRLSHIEIKVGVGETSSILETSAILCYTDINLIGEFIYPISPADLDKYHQFWIYSVTRT